MTKKEFDFSDILKSPGMKRMIEEETIQATMKGSALGHLLLRQIINTAIEVHTVYDHSGPAHQEPGARHWLPGVFRSQVHDEIVEDVSETTACGINSTGMVPDRNRPEKLTCEECITAYAAMRLRLDKEA